MIHVEVQPMDGSQAIALEVNASDTIGDLKLAVSSTLGWPVCRLVLDETVLAHCDTCIEDSGITDGSVLTAIREAAFSMSHGGDARVTHIVPIVIHNHSQLDRQIDITCVKCKSEIDVDYWAESWELLDKYVDCRLTCLDLDPDETLECRLRLRDRMVLHDYGGAPWRGDRFEFITRCEVLDFQITATDLATQESVVLCGKNRGHTEPPDWVLERNAFAPVLTAIDDNDMVALTQLLESGFDVNRAHSVGWSLLHRTAKKGMVSATQLLLERRANVNVPDRSITSNGRTPLDWALWGLGAGHEISALLREHDGLSKEELLWPSPAGAAELKPYRKKVQ